MRSHLVAFASDGKYTSSEIDPLPARKISEKSMAVVHSDVVSDAHRQRGAEADFSGAENGGFDRPLNAR